MTTPGTIQFPSDWLADGRILYYATTPKTGMDVMLTTPDLNSEVWLQTPANEAFARISPDQQWVAYMSDDAGTVEIYVAPLDHHAERTRVSAGPGARCAWSRDGREIYYIADTELFAAPVKISGVFDRRRYAVAIYTAGRPIESLDVAPDGRLLVALREVATATQPLQVITGWREELERREVARLLGH